jgi:methylglutaconyl-CoA hydratase
MSHSSLLFSTNEQGIATLSLNRPEVGNAFNDQLINTLIKQLEVVENDASIHCLILRSEGKHFSAGADLNWMKSMASYDFEHNYQDALVLSKLMDKLYRLSKPTIACVQGAAFGGAIGLIACCDIAIAESNARFCLSEVKLGLCPAVISPYVINAIGARQASRFFLTAEVFDSQKAQKIGLLHDVVDAEALNDCVLIIAGQISRNGPAALAASKALIKRVTSEFPDQTLREDTASLIAKLRVSAEGQEGISAFFEKRPPQWTLPQQGNQSHQGNQPEQGNQSEQGKQHV